ncbi:hypothetical protein BDC45DRAFT_571106 [Circinella umbellata]|nr:hypothetical protein BDC45DRAFT_537393 [Circinella umbellata]KAI7852511.1 hypothetical protein BDC45DRAFT_571106 [Circinella umbellata]
MIDKPRYFTFFENIINTAFSSTGFFTRYNEDFSNVSIVSYGPDPLDLALLVPMRHPGSLRYDPVLQQLKAQEIFLEICCSLVLEGIVRQRLNNGETEPQNRADLLNWLQDIRQEYNQYMDNNPFGLHLHEAKQTLSDVEDRIQSERRKIQELLEDLYILLFHARLGLPYSVTPTASGFITQNLEKTCSIRPTRSAATQPAI